MWHGALLVSEGYRPWEDFIMPISPVSIYLVGIFLSFTEKSWLAFQLFQLLMNFLFLALISLYLVKFEKNRMVVISSLIIFTSFYLLLLTHPWYNIFGAFFLLISIFLASYQSKILLYFAGIFSALTIFTKLDFGILASFSVIAIIFGELLYKNKKLLLQNILTFLIGLISFFIFFISLYQEEILQQTIGIYSEITSNRLNRLLRIIEIKNISLISIGLWCILVARKHKKHFLLYGLIVLSSVATSMFGGIEYTHYYFVFVFPPIIYLCFHKKILKNHLIILLPMMIYLIIPSIRWNAHIIENNFTNSFESEYFNKRNISRDKEIINLNLCSDYLKNIYGPKDFCDLMEMLETEVNFFENDKDSILNISELNFIGAQLGIAPIKDHPIWYKSGQTMNKNFREKIYSEIEHGDYNIILIQKVQKKYSSNKTRIEMINFLNQSKIYIKTKKVYQSPMCMIGNRSIQECGIYVFKRI